MFASPAEPENGLTSMQARKFHREAWRALVISRLRLLFVPFSRIYPRLGKLMVESPQAIPDDCEKLVTGIASAIDRMRWYLPWKSNCLVRAIAAHHMLTRYGMNHTLYIGMATDGEADFQVHAWLRCGSHIVTGGGYLEPFAVVACFASNEQESGTATMDKVSRVLKDVALADFRT